MGGIALLIVIIFIISSRSRIARIEERLDMLQKGHTAAPTAENQEQPAQMYPPDTFTGETAAPEGSPMPNMVPGSVSSAPNQFIEWLKDDLMMKLGALLLIIALGWFVSYAFAENWIGPMGRISLGLVLGALLMAVGAWRIKTHAHQGSIFAVLGSTTIILTIFAAREIYDFFTPATALMLMFFTVVFVAYLSVIYRRQTLAFAGLLLGSASPFFIAAPTPDAAGLFTYLLIVALGTLWVVYLTGWTKLILASLLITSFYSAPYILGSVSDKEVVALFTFIFVSMYYIANLISLVRRREEGSVHFVTHAVTALFTAIFLVTWINAVIPAEWQSLLYVMWAMVFVVGTYVVYLHTANVQAFYIYGSVSIGLIGAATAAELSGPVLTIAYIIEMFALIIAVGMMTRWTHLVLKVSMLNFIPIMLSIESLGSSAWRNGIAHADFVVIALMTLSLGVIGAYIRQLPVEAEDEKGKTVVLTSYTMAIGVYATSLVWLCTHAIMPNDLATLISLVVYTIVGVSLIVLSQVQNSKGLNITGWVFVLGVVGRLLLIDVWEMSLEGRIITFVIIGALLISTAFIKKLQKPTSTEDNQ